MTEKKPMRAELVDDYRIKCQLLLEEVIDAEEAAKLAAAEIAELRAERDRLQLANARLKAALGKKLSPKARKKLGDLSESMIAIGDGRELELILNWYDESRKALGDAS